MAGNKLSARQKMIGVMYLVLTAMLVLQVSSSVLDKFILISKSIEKTNTVQKKQNQKALEHIRLLVKEMGNRKEDIEVLSKAVAIRERTEKVIAYIHALKIKLIELTGGENPITKKPKGLKDEHLVSRVMLNEQEGVRLKTLLNEYTQYLSHTVKKNYALLAVDAKNHHFFKNDPNQATKDFSQLHFDHTPLSTALATLSQFCAEVIYTESDALDLLSRNLITKDAKFDILQPLVSAQSHIVAAGTRYKADLLLAASSSMEAPEMTIDGSMIAVEEGIGKIDFITTPGTYDASGLAKKKFKAAIKLKLPNGEDSVLVKDIEYWVAKPVMQIQAAAVQALYFNCGNELNIQFPVLGAAYNPSFKAVGADVMPGKEKGMVIVIPKSDKVVLEVYNQGSLLGTETFHVRKIPKPEVRVTSGGKVVNERQGMPIPGPRSLEIQVLPDESFQTFLPKEARYRVALWEVTLARGSRAIKVKQVTQVAVGLHEFAALAKPGDRIVIEVKKIERLNFKDEVEIMNNNSIFHIPLY